jgi:REP element-mobilizing transposase RayT
MIRLLDRHWLLTTTTYGTWLPGDKRGFVSPVRAEDGTLELHNIPGTPYDADMPDLQQQAREFLKSDPTRLTRAQAEAILAQLLETARYRGWTIVAASVMHNHMHILVTVPGDPAPSTILQTFKAWASRALNDAGANPRRTPGGPGRDRTARCPAKRACAPGAATSSTSTTGSPVMPTPASPPTG